MGRKARGKVSFVGSVERAMMEKRSSGYGVILVRNGSMENASRSHLQGLSTSNITNALLAAVPTRNTELETVAFDCVV